MSNQCDNCSALECRLALIDEEGIVVSVIIANHHDDLSALHNVYVFETAMECCNLPYVGPGDKWDSENNVFIDDYYSPGLDYDENRRFKVIKTNLGKGHPDYVAPEPEPELTEAEQKLAALGLTKEDLKSLLA
jgi:hypothetical protein